MVLSQPQAHGSVIAGGHSLVRLPPRRAAATDPLARPSSLLRLCLAFVGLALTCFFGFSTSTPITTPSFQPHRPPPRLLSSFPHDTALTFQCLLASLPFPPALLLTLPPADPSTTVLTSLPPHKGPPSYGPKDDTPKLCLLHPSPGRVEHGHYCLCFFC